MQDVSSLVFDEVFPAPSHSCVSPSRSLTVLTLPSAPTAEAFCTLLRYGVAECLFVQCIHREDSALAVKEVNGSKRPRGGCIMR